MVATQSHGSTSETQESLRRRIVAGPSRESLFDSLRLSTCHNSMAIAFTVAPSHLTGRNLAGGRQFVPGNLMFYAVVVMLRPEDGSGDNWLFELSDEHQSLGSDKLRGYMNTTRRTGWVEPMYD